MKGWILFATYISTIFLANWAVARFGVVPVGFGLVAPAAVYFVGAAFPLRDGLQQEKGRRWSYLAIVLGAALSYVVSPVFAVASGVTFLISESTDMLIFTPLRRWTFAGAVMLSSLGSLVIDSAIFLHLAFHSEIFLLGQIVGKTWVTLIALLVIGGWNSGNVLLRNAHSKLAS